MKLSVIIFSMIRLFYPVPDGVNFLHNRKLAVSKEQHTFLAEVAVQTSCFTSNQLWAPSTVQIKPKHWKDSGACSLPDSWYIKFSSIQFFISKMHFVMFSYCDISWHDISSHPYFTGLQTYSNSYRNANITIYHQSLESIALVGCQLLPLNSEKLLILPLVQGTTAQYQIKSERR